MNKSESRYFNTAQRMDRAFLALLAEKDFEYITVKELCQCAGVNRSTFYLHYETLGDLLNESVERTIEEFVRRFHDADLSQKLKTCPLDELFLITPQYLLPYFSYIQENQRLFRTMVERSSSLGLQKKYQHLFQNIFDPILARFQVPLKDRKYTMTFYIHGIVAIVMEWLENGCPESVEEIAQLVMGMIRTPEIL